MSPAALHVDGPPPRLRKPLTTTPIDVSTLTPSERETLLRSRMPPLAEPRRNIILNFLATRFYGLILGLVHLLFHIILKLKSAYHLVVTRTYNMLYHHHRTPQLIQKDIAALARLPQHLSVILSYDGTEDGLDKLIDDVAELSCWCASIGIPMLSVYERTGVLKGYIATCHRAGAQRLHAYYGKERPTLRVRALHAAGAEAQRSTEGEVEDADLEILFISEDDGRESLVDLTRTLCEMAQKGKVVPEDVTQELIDAEITGTFMSEPDLLVIFGKRVRLQGYPPWQVRLTELYHASDRDGVSYQTFLRALYKFAKAEMRFGA